jgi:hypothetical protein
MPAFYFEWWLVPLKPENIVGGTDMFQNGIGSLDPSAQRGKMRNLHSKHWGKMFFSKFSDASVGSPVAVDWVQKCGRIRLIDGTRKISSF